MNHSSRKYERGSTLVVVSVLLSAVLVAGASMIAISGRDLEEASAATRQQALRSCAKAAREVFVSNLRFGKGMPSTFAMQVKDPSGNTILDLGPGHDPMAVHGPKIQDIEFIDDGSLGRGRTALMAETLTNDIGPTAMGAGGAGARVTARCRDTVGRVSEVEFLIRYGL
ncbi:MAG: hypothetical protein P1V51_11175 [Deltaproteobacteria bacterium]|nr:hypothetical protein [Deltaproteobacteria bacterium]